MQDQACVRGDNCPYAHNVFEYWLHPTRYRTQLCNDMEKMQSQGQPLAVHAALPGSSGRPMKQLLSSLMTLFPLSMAGSLAELIISQKQSAALRMDA